jgi:hypothetical protein
MSVYGVPLIVLIIVVLSVAIIYFLVWHLAYYQAQLKWEAARIAEVSKVFSAAYALGANHKFTWGASFEGRFGKNGPGNGRNLAYEGTDLPYTTLASMVMMEQGQKDDLQVALDHLQLWEHEHPQPTAPTVFGRRIL